MARSQKNSLKKAKMKIFPINNEYSWRVEIPESSTSDTQAVK